MRLLEGLTHAGGIVLRGEGPSREFLIVRARRDPRQWVLPKGHIEPGESPERAALREVEEETGVVAEIVGPAGESAFDAAGEPVRVAYFAMRYRSDAPASEDREKRWCSYAEARALLSFDEARRILDRVNGRDS